MSSVVFTDPNHFDAHSDSACNFDADPDPACHLDANADLDPTFHFDADLDPNFQINAQNLKKCSNRLKFIHFGLS